MRFLPFEEHILNCGVRIRQRLVMAYYAVIHHMNTQEAQPPKSVAPSGTDIESVLRVFVRGAVSQLSDAMRGSRTEFIEHSRWDRGPDNHFRERKAHTLLLYRTLDDEWLASLPDYEKSIMCLKSDETIGRHLDALVGTVYHRRRITADSVLTSLLYAMLDDQGALAFTDEKFQRKFSEMIDFFREDQIAFKTVSPLPGFSSQSLPIVLNGEIVIDRLSDDEVTRCYEVGVIRPDSLRFPIIWDQQAVGIRRTVCLPKLILQDDESPELPEAGGEGLYGSRPISRTDLLLDDVLSALRLLKHTKIRASGTASWIDYRLFDSGTQFQVFEGPLWHSRDEFSESDVSSFLAIWRLLEGGATSFAFSIHRFNLAFERRLPFDRIVDLVIAAEALFLGDLDEQYRGELRYRFALRAAKFIEHPTYSEGEIFRVMQRAYDARSAVVHGGSPKDTRLPDNKIADLSTFIGSVEELVRLGLRKALSMNGDASKLRQSDYWNSLLLSMTKCSRQ